MSEADRPGFFFKRKGKEKSCYTKTAAKENEKKGESLIPGEVFFSTTTVGGEEWKKKKKSYFSTWLTNGVRKEKSARGEELVGCISQEFQSAREKNGRKMDLSPPLSSVVSLSLSLSLSWKH